jgi:hypothetical protein
MDEEPPEAPCEERQEFLKHASIRNYVRFRRNWPGEQVSVVRLGDPLAVISLGAELRNVGLDDSLVSPVPHGSSQKIDELCLQLLEKLIERGEREEAGATHLQARKQAITNSLVDYLVCIMLEAIHQDDAFLPASLVVLIRHRLVGANPALWERFELGQKRLRAARLAAQKRHEGEQGSIRQVADLLGLPPSTVARWFREGEFEFLVGVCLYLLDHPFLDPLSVSEVLTNMAAGESRQR